jgi:hypothetical protein
MNKNLFAFLAFVAAALFFGVALFGASLAGVPLLDAGLFSTAIGLAILTVPA